MFYIGIDIAKHKHEASIIDNGGKLMCKSISFSNTQKVKYTPKNGYKKVSRQKYVQ